MTFGRISNQLRGSNKSTFEFCAFRISQLTNLNQLCRRYLTIHFFEICWCVLSSISNPSLHESDSSIALLASCINLCSSSRRFYPHRSPPNIPVATSITRLSVLAFYGHPSHPSSSHMNSTSLRFASPNSLSSNHWCAIVIGPIIIRTNTTTTPLMFQFTFSHAKRGRRPSWPNPMPQMIATYPVVP